MRESGRGVRRRWVGCGAAILTTIALIVTLAAFGRSARAGSPQYTPPAQGMPNGNAPNPAGVGKNSGLAGQPNPMGPSMERRVEHMREDDRHKRLETDAQRLLQMATELKEQVDKTPKDQLSVEVIRRATEVEKLAHDIRERMKD